MALRQTLIVFDGRLSVARIQLLFGGYMVGFTALINSNAVIPTFVMAMIVAAAGALAMPLETQLVRLPVRLLKWRVSGRGQVPATGLSKDSETVKTWASENAKARTDASRDIRRSRSYWSLTGEQDRPDFAVLQLVVGAGLLPLLGLSRFFAPVEWRLVAVTVLSEVVYFSFLAARLIKLGELTDIAREIKETQLQIDNRRRAIARLSAVEPESVAVANESNAARATRDIEMPDKKAERDTLIASVSALQRVQQTLSVRAEVLWRQFGLILDTMDNPND